MTLPSLSPCRGLRHVTAAETIGGRSDTSVPNATWHCLVHALSKSLEAIAREVTKAIPPSS